MTTLHARDWLNTDRSLTLNDFLGRVLAVEVFQMLCPGCVSHGLPQATRIASTFAPDKVAVIGLHSVFEHHDAMTPVALRATPTLVLFDRSGQMRARHFGQVADLALGAQIMALLQEDAARGSTRARPARWHYTARLGHDGIQPDVMWLRKDRRQPGRLETYPDHEGPRRQRRQPIGLVRPADHRRQ